MARLSETKVYERPVGSENNIELVAETNFDTPMGRFEMMGIAKWDGQRATKFEITQTKCYFLSRGTPQAEIPAHFIRAFADAQKKITLKIKEYEHDNAKVEQDPVASGELIVNCGQYYY